jgi:hypothetical protein
MSAASPKRTAQPKSKIPPESLRSYRQGEQGGLISPVGAIVYRFHAPLGSYLFQISDQQKEKLMVCGFRMLFDARDTVPQSQIGGE